ncbi:DNA polymerase beta superfamily protein [Salinibaculum rarum]|uniref:DNA polymerase beta superfamily protein n=1 Tax=Salinibaculum rarum TaxID=3058903 RepID=UPI00265EBC19|nr:nucleotidyltransferase domain-containing protein [Salinibaculum sp. KK48]
MSTNNIHDALEVLEADYDIEIIAARNRGSKPRNLASSSSDTDLSVVFRQSPEAYYRVNSERETIDRSFDNIDILGWNIKRFGELLAKSHHSAFEFLQTPTPYRHREPFAAEFDQLRDALKMTFNPVALMGHYHESARSKYERAVRDEPEINVKPALHVYRALLYRQFVHETHEWPPVNFFAFVKTAASSLDVPDKVVADTQELVEQKRADETIAINLESLNWIANALESMPTAGNDRSGKRDDHLTTINTTLTAIIGGTKL